MKGIAVLIFCGLVSFAAGARDLNKELSKVKLKVGAETIQVYVADTDEKRATGLMHITALSENEGMIFVFDQEEPLAFWMKNTLIPLNIGYFNAKAELIDIQEMSVPSLMEQRPPSYPSKGPARFALEMNKGWFARHKVRLGAKLSLVSTSSSNLLNSALAKSPTRP